MTQYRPATQRAHAAAWDAWEDWRDVALTQSDRPPPDDYALLERYLVDQWLNGVSPPTLDAIYARLRIGWTASGSDWPDPERALPGRWQLARERRAVERKQAQALTAARLATIETSDSVPARDIALIRTMRDGLLSAADVRTRRWADVKTLGTGPALLRVTRRERHIWLSPETAESLAAMRPDGATDDDPVFATRRSGLLRPPRAETLTAWIGRAAREAGLGAGYSSRSPRYGMLLDLPEHVGRDPLPDGLGWALDYANPEVVRWYTMTPPPGDATALDPHTPSPGHTDLDEAAQLRAWLHGQGPSATSMWQRLGVHTETVRAWRAGRSRPPAWIPLVVAAYRRAGGAPAEDAPDLQRVKRDGEWSDAALAAGLGVSRATVRRWLDSGAPDLVLRYAIGELELRVPPVDRSGRGAAAKLSNPSYRAIDWPADRSARRDEAGAAAQTAATAAEAPRATAPGEGTTLEDDVSESGHGAEATTTETAHEPDALPGDPAHTRDAPALVHVALTQLQQALTLDDPQSADDALREAAAAGLEAGTPQGLETAARALARRADALGARPRSAPDDADAYREMVALYREAAGAGLRAATSTGRAIAARANYNSGVFLRRSGGSDAEIEDAYRDATSLGRAAGDSEGLRIVAHAQYELGRAYKRWNRPDAEVEAAYRAAVEAGRAAGDTQTLEIVARASNRLAVLLAQSDAPQADIEAAYRVAVEAGREADTADGCLIAARAHAGLAFRLEAWGRPEDAMAAHHGAAALGRAAGGTKGLELAAAELLVVATHLAQSDAPQADVEAAYRDAAEAGREADTAGGRLIAARAHAALAARLEAWGRPADAIAAHDDAAALGRAAGGPEGLEVAAAERLIVAAHLARSDAPQADIEAAYRDAADAGEASDRQMGLAHAAAARLDLADLLMEWVRQEADFDAEYRSAVSAGRRSGTPEGLWAAAQASLALAIAYADPDDTDEVRLAFRAAVEAWRDVVRDGRAAGTPEALGTAASASATLARLLRTRDADPAEIEEAWRDAVRDGRESDTPAGLATAASASVSLAGQLRDWGRDLAEIAEAWRDAARDGRAAATKVGFATAAQALVGLADELRERDHRPVEIAGVHRDAVAAARKSGTADALLVVGRSLCRAGTEESYRQATALAGEAAKLTRAAELTSGSPSPGSALSAALNAASEAAAAATWRLLGAEAALGLGRVLLQRAVSLGSPEPQVVEEAVAALREAAAAGAAAGTRRGQEIRGEAMIELAVAYGGYRGRDATTPGGLWALIHDQEYREARERAEAVESAYRMAASAGMAAKSPAGQLITAKALVALGDAYQKWQRPRTDIEEPYRAAARAGRDAGTQEGLEWTALGLLRIGEASSKWPWSRERVVATCREAAAAGREAGTPKGLRFGSIAMRFCGDALSQGRRWRSEPREDIAAAYRQAAAMAREAQTPEALIEVSRALLALALAHKRWGEPSEELFDQAVAAGRDAGPDGSPHAATALIRLAEARKDWGRPQREIVDTYNDAADTASRVWSKAGRTAVASARHGIYEAYRDWGRTQAEIDAAKRAWHNARDG